MSSPISHRTESSVPTPRTIVAWAGRPALMAVPAELVTWTLAICEIEPRLRMPEAGATKMMAAAPALKTLVARAPEPHSLAPLARSVQSTIAILPLTPLTAPQAPVGWKGAAVTTIAMSVGPTENGRAGSFTEARD